jgi:hypothetical protein
MLKDGRSLASLRVERQFLLSLATKCLQRTDGLVASSCLTPTHLGDSLAVPGVGSSRPTGLPFVGRWQRFATGAGEGTLPRDKPRARALDCFLPPRG